MFLFSVPSPSLLARDGEATAEGFKLLGFYVPKSRYDYEARRGIGLRVNFDHLGFSKGHPVHSTRTFLHLALIEMRPPRPVFDPAP